MRKLGLIFVLVSMSSSVFAQSLSCDLNILVADKGGYVSPVEAERSVKIHVQTEVLSKEACTKIRLKSLNLSACAVEADFQGGFEVAVIMFSGSVGDVSILSTSTLGTLKNGKGLQEITGVTNVLSSVIEKNRKVGVETPPALTGDSLQLDEAVKQGLEKGALAANEPVVISLGSCRLAQ